MKAAHLLRRPDAAGHAAAVAHRHGVPRTAESAPGAYPPGYFTALMRRQNWPPGFQSQLSAEVRRGAPSTELRAAGGYDAHPLNLPGAVQHLERAGKR